LHPTTIISIVALETAIGGVQGHRDVEDRARRTRTLGRDCTDEAIMTALLYLLLAVTLHFCAWSSIYTQESNAADLSSPISIPIKKRKTKSVERRNRYLKELPAEAVELSDFYNNEYVGSIGIGTPPQYLTVVFDSGSSDIWLPGSKCVSCGTHTLFDEDESSSFAKAVTSKGVIATFMISYGSGDVIGIIAFETITLSNLSLPDVKIGLAYSEDETISKFDMDGIVGLGFDGLAVVTKPSVIDAVTYTYPNLSHSFSIYLSTDPEDVSKPSSITFGGYDLSIVSETAEFYYTPVVRDASDFTYWTVSMNAFEVLETNEFFSEFDDDVTASFSVCRYGDTCLAIIDSGTSGIGIPTQYMSDILTLVTAGKDCQGLVCVGVGEDDFPVILIYLAPDNIFPLLSADYTECSRKYMTLQYRKCPFVSSTSYSNYIMFSFYTLPNMIEYSECEIRFQESSDFWILGDAFIEAYYTHFDIEVRFAWDWDWDWDWDGIEFAASIAASIAACSSLISFFRKRRICELVLHVTASVMEAPGTGPGAILY
jgi:hypothetical protein